MSGIAGIIRFDGGEAQSLHVKAMTAWMGHRGSDGISHWEGQGAALGHCLTCTTRESLEEEQPLANDDGSLVLVMDGRVDNWEELKADLDRHGARLRNGSDSELVLRAYELWGADCLDRIDGDFAFVIWNTKLEEAFCARDRFGIKPFVYHFDGTVLSFASELRPVLDLPWVPKNFNRGMAAEFLGADWRSVDETFWTQVLRLPPNSRMVVSKTATRIETYWHPELAVHDPAWSDAECVSRYRELLRDSVRRLSRSHQPLSFEVSGGLDSSAVFAVGEHLRREGKLLSPAMQGYTLAFDPQSEADDLPYAQAVGKHLGHSIAEIEPTYRPLDWSEDEVAREAEFPSYPNGIMGAGIRQAAASRGSKVLLVGIGADEQLSGPRDYYAKSLRSMAVSRFVSDLKADAAEAGYWQASYWALRHGFFRVLPNPVQRLAALLISSQRQGRRYRPETWLTKQTTAELAKRKVSGTASSGNDVLQSLFHPYSVWCREREGAMAEQAAIELRYPFLTRPLVEFMLRLPSRQRIRGHYNKFIHRQAMAGYLPQELLRRGPKANFMMVFAPHISPISRWIEDNGQAADLEAWIDWRHVARVSRDARGKDFGGWPEFMLWTLFGCGALAKLASKRVEN